MFRKVVTAAVAAVAVTATTGSASAQLSVGVSIGTPRAVVYRPYVAPVYARPVVVAQAPVLPPPVVVTPPVAPVAPAPCAQCAPPVVVAPAPVVPICGQQDFLLPRPARNFANAMSARGYQVRLQSHGLGWRVVYTLPVR